MKRVCYLYPYPIEQYYFNKDVGEIPIYLNKLYDCNVDFVFFNDNGINIKDTKGVKFIQLKRVIKKKFMRNNRLFELVNELKMIRFYIKNIKKYDVLFLYHLSFFSWFYFKISKIFHKNMKLVLKLDIDQQSSRRVSFEDKNIFRKLTLGNLARISDLIICETSTVYSILNKGIYGQEVSNKLLWLPNGINIEELKTIKSGFKKENIIITVGRIGTYQKNTEFLLDSLKGLDLKNWTVYVIGPIEEAFNKEIEKFKNNLNICFDIVFTGGIFNKTELYEYFAKAKVFILTSRFESYGLVLNEAFSFSNYILTTDVGAAKDIISISNDETVGKIISDSEELMLELKNYCSLNGSIDSTNYEIKDDLSWEVILDNDIVKKVFSS